MTLDFKLINEKDLIKILFSEKVGVVLQSNEDLAVSFAEEGIDAVKIGTVNLGSILKIEEFDLEIKELRKIWMSTSSKLETNQTKSELATIRLENVTKQPLSFRFPKNLMEKYQNINQIELRQLFFVKREVILKEKWLI